MIRRLIGPALVVLTVIAAALAAAPWLRAFPSAVVGVPLAGAVVLGVLAPMAAMAAGVRRLWLTALIDVAAWLVFELVVVLHDPLGFGRLWSGLVHGPAQLLTFALPLVSPRSLLVAPIALVWMGAAVGGECAARRWTTIAPYAAWLVVFGLSVAATQRAADGAHAVSYSAGMGALLLVAMLAHRTASVWLDQSEGALQVTDDGRLPLRSVGYGLLTAALVALIAAVTMRVPAFTARSVTPERVPGVDTTQPLAPLAYVASLRPATPSSPGTPVFTVTTGAPALAYVSIADVDYYAGDGWSFQRTFRPSGGVVPADPDPAMRAGQHTVAQRYTIADGPLTSAPWLPTMERVQRVTGVSVDVDTGSAMVVPSRRLAAGERYDVVSSTPTTSFEELNDKALTATSTPPIDLQVPGELRAALADITDSFGQLLGVDPTADPLGFLRALQVEFQQDYALYETTGGSPAPPSGTVPSSTPAASASSSSALRRAGGTSFADVLASIVSEAHTATPEQFATMFALIARQIGVPARVATGFRLDTASSGSTAAAGTYHVTTADAWSWVEIPIRGHGWVIADVSPGTYSTAHRTASAGVQSSSSGSTPPTQGLQLSQASAGHAVAPRSHTASGSSGGPVWPLALVAAIATAALLLLAISVALLRKLLRRRRRRRGDPRHRVLGAWNEGLDRLSESGRLPHLDSLTSSEVTERVAEAFGARAASHVWTLGEAANRALYATSARIDDGDADHAWATERALRREVSRQLDSHSRVAAALAYHRHSPAPPPGPASWQQTPGAHPVGAAAGRAVMPQRPGRRRSH